MKLDREEAGGQITRALKVTLKFYAEGSRNPSECFKPKNDIIRYDGCQHVQFSSTNTYGGSAACLALAQIRGVEQ